MRRMNGLVAAAILSLAVVCPAMAADGDGGQVVTRAGAFAPSKGAPDKFTGSVLVERVFKASAAAPYTAARVTFEPGARTNWHSHVAGQHLIVTWGVGLTGTEDGTVVEIRAGDEIWCPPNVRHWHGAAPHSAMTHVAVTGVIDGKNTTWMEPVTDEQYTAR